MRALQLVPLFTLAISCTSKSGESARGFASSSVVTERPLSILVSCREVRLAPGETTNVHVWVTRTPGVAKSVELNAVNLPRGVTADSVNVAPDATEADLILHATPEARAAHHPARIYAYSRGGEFASASIPLNVAPSSARSIAAFAEPAATRGAPGSLDSSFGGTGFARVDSRRLLSPTALEDGSVVTVNYQTTSDDRCSTVTKFASGGSLDRTFGLEGNFILDFPGENTPRATALAADGSLRLLGSLRENSRYVDFVARITPDGQLDRSFGDAGVRRIETAWALRVDGELRTVTVGVKGDALVLTRILPNGALDTSFGAGGSVTINEPEWRQNFIGDMSIDHEGRILVASFGHTTSSRGIQVFRFSASGSIDTAFGSAGEVDFVMTGTEDGIADVAEDDQGRVLVLAYVGRAYFGTGAAEVRRLLPDGALDTSFGTGSVARVDVGSGFLTELLPRADKIVLAGRTFDPSGGTAPSGGLVVRLTGDGLVDDTFGSEGRVALDGNWVLGAATAVDGRIVIAGSTASQGFVARLWN